MIDKNTLDNRLDVLLDDFKTWVNDYRLAYPDKEKQAKAKELLKELVGAIDETN